MPTKVDYLQGLARICRQLGGRLAIVSQRAFDGMFEQDQPTWKDLHSAPFTDAHGLHWNDKIIYAVRGREQVGSIIHEMGHVFAAQHHPECYCGECHEWHWFGWEIAVARKIAAGRIWSKHNADYQTGSRGYPRWGTLTPKRRRKVAAERFAHAQKIGVLDSEGNPRSVR